MPTAPDADLLAEFLKTIEQEGEIKTYFVRTLVDPTFHWFFHQGQQALQAKLYVPGVSALLNGIEASVRITLAQMKPGADGKMDLSDYRLLSNVLLKQAQDSGLPVRSLAFPGEDDFNATLSTKNLVRVVQLRHDICHGNITKFIEKTDDEGIEFFTPECLRETGAILLGMAIEWAHQLAAFRAATGLRTPSLPIPKPPKNPLSHFLTGNA